MDEIELKEVRDLLDTVYYKAGGLHQSPRNFNALALFLSERDEVNLHSCFIGELLNPEGRHGFGDAFLRAWLDTMNRNGAFAFDGAIARREKYKIDILITNARKQAIIIENKIGAKDQDKQLPRYIQKLMDEGYKRDDLSIVYLTLDGHPPPIEDIEQLEKSGFDCNSLRYSYQDDVKRWLQQCIGIAAQKPTLRETLVMYLDIVLHLTNQAGDSKMNQAILSEILSRPAYFKTAAAINEAFLEAKVVLQSKFWRLLECEMQKKVSPLGLKWEEGNSPRSWSTDDRIRNYYEGSRNRYHYGQETDIGKWDTSTHLFFRIAVDDIGVYFGVIARNPGSNEATGSYDNRDERFAELAKLAKRILPGIEEPEQYWIGWARFSHLNFSNFTPESNMLQLVSDDAGKKLVSELVSEMAGFLEPFQAGWPKLQRSR